MNRYIPAIITGFAVTPFLVLQPALTQPNPGFYPRVRQSVVLVQNEAGVRQGTGFIVLGGNGTYYAITAGHVLRDRQPPNAQLQVLTATGERVSVEPIDIPGVDLALLKFTSTQQYPLARIANNAENIQPATRIFVLGYPARGSGEPEILGGNVSSRQGSGLAIFHSAPTLPGMSGSPVLTESGEIVGIHIGQTEAVKEAIPIERYINSLPSVFARLARNNLAANDFNGAIAIIDQGRQLGISDNEETASILAYAHFGLGNFDRAREEVRRVSSSNANAALLLGVINYTRNDYPGAINNAEDANRLDPRNLGGYALAILGLSQAENQLFRSEANLNSSNAINLLSNNAFANFARSCVRVRSGEIEDAARFLDIARRANSQIQDPFLRIIIPRLQETIGRECLSEILPVTVLPIGGGGRYRVVEPSITLEVAATAIVVSSNSQFIAVGMRNGTVSIYSLQTKSRVGGIFSSGQTNTPISSVAFSPNGQEIAVASSEGEVKIFDINRPEREKYKLDAGISPSVIFSDNNNFLFVGGVSGTLRLVNNRTGQILTSNANTHERGISSLTLSPDGRLLASGGGDGTVKLWSTSDLTPIDTYQAHQRGVQNLVFSVDGNQIISTGLDGLVRSCNWRSKECTNVASPRDVVRSLAVSSNGHVAFSAPPFINTGTREENDIFLQDLKSGQSFDTLSGHRERVNALAYTPDGRYLISGSDDRTLIIWEVQ